MTIKVRYLANEMDNQPYLSRYRRTEVTVTNVIDNRLKMTGLVVGLRKQTFITTQINASIRYIVYNIKQLYRKRNGTPHRIK